MNLGELAIKIGVIGDTKKLDKTINQMEEAEKHTKRLIKYRKDLAAATSEDEKKLIKENFAQQVKLDKLNAQNKAIKKQNTEWLSLAKGIGAVVGAATLAYKVVDRMISSLASANQQMITFQRTTGISFASLNKYASANAAVNMNSSIEGTAQTMQRLANNLWDIRMGRGDISPYQELAFVGGKAFNPMGMSVEQVIENVREAIKGVDDIQATNIIQRMGFAPDDLLMLRMGREEFEKINNLFLNREQREQLYKYGLEIKKINLQFNLLKDKALLKVIPLFIKLSQHLTNIAEMWGKVASNIVKMVQANDVLKNSIIAIGAAIGALMIKAHPLIALLTAIYLIIEDIAVYFLGGKSLTGLLVKGIQDIFKNIQEAVTNSSIGNFFDEIKEGVQSLNGLNWDWLDKINRWVGMNIMRDRAKYKNMGYTDEQINQIIDTGIIPSVNNNQDSQPTPPVNTNQLSYATNNINTSNSFTINSNQPTDIIATNLINTFTPTQAQLSSMAV